VLSCESDDQQTTIPYSTHGSRDLNINPSTTTTTAHAAETSSLISTLRLLPSLPLAGPADGITTAPSCAPVIILCRRLRGGQSHFAMFEHFTFGAEAPDRLLCPDISPSPTDISFPPAIQQPPTSCPPADTDMSATTQPSINDIMCRLRDQTLQPCEELPQQSEWNSPFPAPFRKHDQTFSHSASLPNIHLTSGPRSGPIACRRLQRQLNVQLQSSKSHMRDVKALVEDMITANSQCALRESASHLSLPTPPPSHAEETCSLSVDPMIFEPPSLPHGNTDEGFHESEEPLPGEKAEEKKLVYRRACAPGGIRKATIAAEWTRGTNQIVVGGRVLVRSTPRMRKRRSRPPPVPE
jgi:hypothetical protein